MSAFKPALDVLETREVPATFTVNTLADTIAVNNTLSLREAISLNTGALAFNQLSAAEKALISGPIGTNDRIQFTTGGTINLTADLPALTKKLSIEGPGAGQLVIDGGSQHLPFNIGANGDVTISELRVTNGHNADSGGAVVNGGKLKLFRVELDHNTADKHGAAVENNGTLVIDQSYLHDNTAAKVGGAIDNNATATITNSTLANNTAGNTGGAIWSDGALVLSNVTVVNNHAVNAGGGLRVTGGTATITSSTITGNDADSDGSNFETGGGISNDGGTVTLNNTVVAQNLRDMKTVKSDIAGAVGGQFNFIGVGTDLTGVTNGTNGNKVGTNASPLDPKLQPLALNGGFAPTRRPAQDSPLIGAGAPSAIAGSTDQRGFARPDTGTTIGAIEANVPAPAQPQSPPQSEPQTPVIAVGLGAGAPGFARALNGDGSVRFDLAAFPGFAGGVKVATGDVNGDGVRDVVVGTATGPSVVLVFDGATGAPITAFVSLPGGTSLASGDVNGDGFADVIVGTASGAGIVGVFDGRTGALMNLINALPGSDGVNVAAGDLDGDGVAEILVSTARGPGLVGAFDGRTGALRGGFVLPSGGVHVASGDLDGDGRAEIVVAGGTIPYVAAFDASGAQRGATFIPGVTSVAAEDLDGDGKAEIVLGSLFGSVRTLRGTDLSLVNEYLAFGAALPGGVFVG